MEDTHGLRPRVQLVKTEAGLQTKAGINPSMASILRSLEGFWRGGAGETGGEGDFRNKDGITKFEDVAMVESGGTGAGTSKGVMEMRRKRWSKWLRSGMYGIVVDARLKEIELGRVGAEGMDLGRNERKMLGRLMRKYVMVDGKETKLFFRERDGQLASCVLEGEVEKILYTLHEATDTLRRRYPWVERMESFIDPPD